METCNDVPMAAHVHVPCPLHRIRGTYTSLWHIAGPAVSVWVHWLPDFKRSMPCVVYRCPHCREGLPRRPLSYVPAYLLRGNGELAYWSRSVLELPLRTGRELFNRIGSVVCLRRARPCGPVDVGRSLLPVPQCDGKRFEVLPTLFALWRIPSSMQVALVGPGYTE